MYILKKEFRFEAAHVLLNHNGKCQRLHGHSWKATVYIKSGAVETEGPRSGMVVDFYDITKVAQPIIEKYLDHHFLNDTLNMLNPTCENIACWFYSKLKESSEVLGTCKLLGVSIDETCTSSCFYSPFSLREMDVYF